MQEAYPLQQHKLTKEQREAVGLLSIGTFLEYFDLMLYIHMAVLLNDIFFPKTDPHTAKLLSACAFCSTYVFRPVGALIFGYIGDKIGRSITVIITTGLMGLTCLCMAILPTYKKWGIVSSIVMIVCRIIQGMSSMGEINGAELYITEMTKPPAQYPAVAMVLCFCSLGGTVALGIGVLVMSFEFDWRLCFYLGAGIAVFGTVARRALRETPEFVNAKVLARKAIEEGGANPEEIMKKFPTVDEKVNKITSLALLLVHCGWPICFYFVYIHCGNILKHSFGFSPLGVMRQNFAVSLTVFFWMLFLALLSKKIYPLRILKAKLVVFFILVFACPYLLSHASSSFDLLLIQLAFSLFGCDAFPAVPILMKHFPVFKRFTYTSFLYAFSRMAMSPITSFGLVYLIDSFGDYGLLIIMIPCALGFTFGIYHFEKLEIKVGNYVKVNFPHPVVKTFA